jgi:hypothetical protein
MLLAQFQSHGMQQRRWIRSRAQERLIQHVNPGSSQQVEMQANSALNAGRQHKDSASRMKIVDSGQWEL